MARVLSENSRAGNAERLAQALIERRSGKRQMIAIAGAPGSGKSTLAHDAAEALAARGVSAAVIPMDGFHYDDAVLAELKLSDRKGAPETFDFEGFECLLKRLASAQAAVAIPLFDRSMELSRAAAALVHPETEMLLVEGNYLHLDEEPWRRLSTLFDLRIFLDVSLEELERRLNARWADHGREAEAALRWVQDNDLPNARRVINHRLPADLVLGGNFTN
ncbi:nucleoside/nucleotide kinase family protein [Nitratireductor basaltis]